MTKPESNIKQYTDHSTNLKCFNLHALNGLMPTRYFYRGIPRDGARFGPCTSEVWGPRSFYCRLPAIYATTRGEHGTGGGGGEVTNSTSTMHVLLVTSLSLLRASVYTNGIKFVLYYTVFHNRVNVNKLF